MTVKIYISRLSEYLALESTFSAIFETMTISLGGAEIVELGFKVLPQPKQVVL